MSTEVSVALLMKLYYTKLILNILDDFLSAI